MNDRLREKIAMLPESPGCYIMKSQGEIIYIGKAVNLKNRVRQYFHGSHTPKVAAMAARVDDFDLMLCQTNFEALTLEFACYDLKHIRRTKIIAWCQKPVLYINFCGNINPFWFQTLCTATC